MNECCGHRKFAAVWDFAARHEGRSELALREEVMSAARGHTLEIGFGVGSNWPYLPADVEYVGIEPDPHMRKRAAAHVPQGRHLTLANGNAEALDFPDAAFDTVIGTLVFCTIPDAGAALAEVRRVLKPGGEFRFLEHVRAKNRVGAAVQDAIRPLWSRLGGGCNPNRNTLALISAAGFEMAGIRNVKVGPLPAIVGGATKPIGSSS
jgi:ubiquinone/menaquinone biosynthesis C-methylase UbiE